MLETGKLHCTLKKRVCSFVHLFVPAFVFKLIPNPEQLDWAEKVCKENQTGVSREYAGLESPIVSPFVAV